jgi:hypothetical protein
MVFTSSPRGTLSVVTRIGFGAAAALMATVTLLALSTAVAQADVSAVTVDASPVTALVGQSVTFHAFVDPSDGGGTVSFTSDGTAISGCSNQPFISGGGTDWEAICTTASLASGNHTITAAYSGDAAYAGSSGTTTEGIYQSATSTSLTASPSSTLINTPVTLTADVYSSDGGGTLTFTSGGKAISGCASLSLKPVSSYYQATCTHTWTAAASYTIGAQYSGDVAYGSSSASTTVAITSLAPKVSSISPNAGPVAGGQTVTIIGTNLTGATGVAFGTTGATGVTVVSDTELTATVPAHAAGTVNVTVTTPKGTSAAARYTYDPVPTVSAISPASGGQGTVVAITGTGFVPGSKVKFGSVAAKASSLVSATQLTATVPAGAGTVDTTVTTPGGASATSPADQFAYVIPTVSSVSPNAGPVAGGQTVTIHGTNLTGAYMVTFGLQESYDVTVVSDTVLTVTAPVNNQGMVDAVVTTLKGTSAITPADRYTYDPVPGVAALGLNQGPVSGGTVADIYGWGFVSGPITVKFGAKRATSVKRVSDTELLATAPAGTGPGSVDVTVTTPGGTSFASPDDLFYYMAAS